MRVNGGSNTKPAPTKQTTPTGTDVLHGRGTPVITPNVNTGTYGPPPPTPPVYTPPPPTQPQPQTTTAQPPQTQPATQPPTGYDYQHGRGQTVTRPITTRPASPVAQLIGRLIDNIAKQGYMEGYDYQHGMGQPVTPPVVSANDIYNRWFEGNDYLHGRGTPVGYVPVGVGSGMYGPGYPNPIPEGYDYLHGRGQTVRNPITGEVIYPPWMQPVIPPGGGGGGGGGEGGGGGGSVIGPGQLPVVPPYTGGGGGGGQPTYYAMPEQQPGTGAANIYAPMLMNLLGRLFSWRV